MRVRFTPAALNHLGEIGEYIAKDSPGAARRVIQAIRRSVDLIRGETSGFVRYCGKPSYVV